MAELWRSLHILNLQRVVFDIMGGRRNPTPHDGAYSVLIFLTVISAILTLPLLIAYGIGIYNTRKAKNTELHSAQHGISAIAADE